MTKPLVIYTRPLGWQEIGSDKLDLVYVPLCGKVPLRKNGKPASDGHYAAATREGVEKFISTAKKLQPQAIVRWVHPGLNTKTLRRLREVTNATIFCADGNQPNRVSNHIRQYRKFIDVAMINSRSQDTLAQYAEEGIPAETFYEAVIPEQHVPVGRQRSHDIFFGGSNRKVRRNMKREWEFPKGEFRFRLVIALAKKFKLLLRGSRKEWDMLTCYPTLHDLAYYAEFQRARTALGCNQYRLERYYTRRTFHAGASGRLFVTKYIPGMERDFENHRHLVWFEEIEEAEQLFAKYLRDKAAAKRIAERGRNLFLERHSWRARLVELERIVAKYV